VAATGEDLKVGLAGGKLEHVMGRLAHLQGEVKKVRVRVKVEVEVEVKVKV
jgi:hypothetical protein